MISFIEGNLISKQTTAVIINVAGVGYEVVVSLHTLWQLPAINESVHLHTHFVVREDAQLLYGFYTPDEKQLFRLLIKINAVGPKIALAILSSMSVNETITAINQKNANSFNAVPGIGKKTAQKLLIELADKINILSARSGADQITTNTNQNNIKLQEVEQALISLGYKMSSISPLLKKIDTANLSIEEILKKVLQSMAS